MIPPETAVIKPEAKKVTSRRSWGKTAAAQTRAAWARIDQAERTRRE
jgi:hypothetical protein